MSAPQVSGTGLVSLWMGWRSHRYSINCCVDVGLERKWEQTRSNFVVAGARTERADCTVRYSTHNSRAVRFYGV